MKKKKPLGSVMVRPGARTTFRRSIRNAKGGIVRKLEFPPGTPVDLTSRQELEAIYNDIGKALVIVERNDMGQAKPDWDATGEVVRERDGRPAGGDAEEVDGEEPEGIVIDLEIDEDLVELLKRHQAELPSPVTVESLADWVKEGNSFTTLDGFTVDSVSRLHQALALDPPGTDVETEGDDGGFDLLKLIGAGLSEDLAASLAKNAGEHPWVMDPEQIKAKVAEGFDLTTLTDIGGGRMKQIKTALGIAESK